MNSWAMRSVWKSDLPPIVRVVMKKVRNCPLEFCASDGLDGFATTGAKAHSFFSTIGTIEVVP